MSVETVGIDTPAQLYWGSEIEHSCDVARRNQDGQLEMSSLYSDELATLMAYGRDPQVLAVGSVQNQYLTNGGRFYIDINLLEYATPECDSITGAVVAELAGEQYVAGMFERASLSEEAGYLLRDGYEVHKRVINKKAPDTGLDEYIPAYNSCGYHNNLGIREGNVAINSQALRLFTLHCATRSLYLGAGTAISVFPNTPNGKFITDQKAPFVTQSFGSSTMYNRAIVNSRNESYDNNQKRWVRIHDASANAPISPWAMIMNKATGSLVLRMIDAGMTSQLEALNETQIMRLFRRTAYDPFGSAAIDSPFGKIRPVDVQEMLVEKARYLAEISEVTPEELWGISQWEAVIDEIKKDDMKKMAARGVDWAMKKYRMLKDSDVPEKDRVWTERDWAQDQRYDVIISSSGKSGLGRGVMLRDSKLWKHLMPPNEIVKRAIYEAPTRGRAPVRAAFIEDRQITTLEELADLYKVSGMAWDQVRVEDENEEGRTRLIRWPMWPEETAELPDWWHSTV